ncbi:hypothetical protein RND81_11G166000 [Saponaria officinalis]|uniref:Ribosome-binding factor A, chloroplastic n=1 Tax=Saponaria officinalis TaxID=3572 RepID=A0AAW1HPM1_SAPOF
MSHLLLLHKLPIYHLKTPPSLSSSQLIKSRVEIFGRRNNFGGAEAQQIKRGSVKCMANPRRVAMVAKQIRRELSEMLLTDKNLQYAVLPEAALGADRFLSSVTTISDVEVSADLQVVKVYVSIFGDDRGREVALSGLKAKAKYVRGKLGKRMKLRLTPEIRFIEDESLERGSRVIAILDKIKSDNEQKDDGFLKEKGESSNSPVDDDNWEDDDTDEGVIYVR